MVESLMNLHQKYVHHYFPTFLVRKYVKRSYNIINVFDTQVVPLQFWQEVMEDFWHPTRVKPSRRYSNWKYYLQPFPEGYDSIQSIKG